MHIETWLKASMLAGSMFAIFAAGIRTTAWAQVPGETVIKAQP
jgi:hypothetical protein